MDTTVRNLDEAAYRKAKARAALEGKTIGEVISDALVAFTGGDAARSREPGPLQAAPPVPRPPRSAQRPGQRFVRPFPGRGAFLDNPLVVFEVEDP